MSVQAQVRTADGVILAVGLFPAGSPDPGIEIVTLADAEAEKLGQPGTKTLAAGVVTVEPPEPLPDPGPSRDDRLLTAVDEAKAAVAGGMFTAQQVAVLQGVFDGLGAAIRGES